MSNACDADVRGDAVQQRTVACITSPLRAPGRHFENERGGRAEPSLGGEHEERRAAALGGAGEPRPPREAVRGVGSEEVENDQGEAPGGEQEIGRSERIGAAAGLDPEHVGEEHAGGGGGFGVERVVWVDPGDERAGAGDGGDDTAGEAGAPGAAPPRDLGDASAGKAAADEGVEREGPRGEHGGSRAGVGRPEEDVPGTAQVGEEVGGCVHGHLFAFCSPLRNRATVRRSKTLRIGVGVYRSGRRSGSEGAMTMLLRRLVQDDRGQDLAEYGIALAVIAAGAVLAVTSIGTQVQTLWTVAQNSIPTLP